MKKAKHIHKIALITGLVITSFTAISNTFLGANPTVIETEKTIRDYFKFPQIVLPINQSEKVEVLFTTNQNGRVDFVLAKTTDINLKTEIEKQFLKLNLVKLNANVVHSITLKIKTM